jgi:hypothetical protein
MSENNSLPDFDSFEPIQIKFPFRGKSYVLAEATKGAVVKFREAVFRATRPGPDMRPTTFQGLPETELLLVSQCLYHADEAGNLVLDKKGNPDKSKLVSMDELREWPDRVVSPLFQKAQQISEMDRGGTVEEIDRQIKFLQGQRAKLLAGQEEDPAKNAPADTTENSD